MRIETGSDPFTVVLYTYNNDGKVETEMYYDENGNPFKLNSGTYGYLYENGKTSCLNANGEKFFSLSYFLHHSRISVILAGTILLLFIMLPSQKINLLLLVAYTAFIVHMTIWDRTLQYNTLYLTFPLNAYLFFTSDEYLVVCSVRSDTV